MNTNLLRDIWFRPRKCMSHLLDTDPERGIWPLAILWSFVHALNNAVDKSLGDQVSPLAVVGFCVFFSVLLGPLALFFNAWITGLAARLLGCEAREPEKVRSALAWGSLPYGAAVVPIGLATLMVGGEMFQSSTPKLDGASESFLFLFLALVGSLAVLWCWSVVTTAHTLGETYQVSAWKGLAIQSLPLAILIGGILLMVLAPGLISGL